MNNAIHINFGINKRAIVYCFTLIACLNITVTHTQEILLTHEEPISRIQIDENGRLLLAASSTIYTYKDNQKIEINITIDEEPDFFIPWDKNTFAVIVLDRIEIIRKDNILFSDTLPDIITSVQEYGDSLLIATGKGIYILDHRHQLSKIPGLEGEYINNMDILGHHLYVALDYGIGQIDLNTKDLNIHRLDKIVNYISVHPDGRIIILTAGHEIILINRNLKIEQQKNISIGEIRSITSSFNDTFLGSSEGCYSINPDLTPQLIFKGSVNQVLACSNTLLIVQENDLVKKNITSQEVRSEKTVVSLCAGNDILWVGTEGEILGYRNDKNVLTIPIPTVKEQLFVSAIVTDDLHIYAGTMGAGVFIFDKKGKLKRHIYKPEKINQNNIIQIKKLNGTIWVAYLNGVFTIDSSSFRIKRDYGDILENNYLYCFEPVSDDTFYVGTSSKGILHYQRGIQSSFLDGKSVYSLAKSKNKDIIAGTEKKGTWILHDELPVLIDRHPGIISTMNLSKANLLVTKSQILVKPTNVMTYSAENNMTLSYPVNELRNGQLNSITENDQYVYVGFENGFMKIDKERLFSLFETKLHPIRPFLFNQPIEDEKSQFSPRENSLSFNYHNESYNQITPTIFKYRLLGLDDNWQLTRQKTINYYNLSAGTYNFQVASGFNTEFIPDKPEGYKFSIAKPIWKTTGFIIGMILIAIALVIFLIRRREQLLVHREKREQEKIRFELEQLKNQIDPHFLFNSLNSLVGLMEENPGSASTSLQDLSDLYRNILKYEKMELIPINEDVELGKKYFDIHKIRFEELIHLNIERSCNPDGWLLPMTIQFLIENAIKHNIINSGNPLSIFIRIENSTILVSNTYQPKKHGLETEVNGLGLKNLKSRYLFYTPIPIEVIKENNTFTVKVPILHD